jgi:DNA-binding SARP family transcriptional activator
VLHVRLLGPVVAMSQAGPIPLGGSKPRALLATLVLEQGRIVPTTRLVDVLWPNDPPESARSLIQTYVSTLRKSFLRHGFRDLIGTQPPGYLIRRDQLNLDTDVFTELLGRARELTRTADHEQATELLRRAVALCHGSALSGLEAPPLSAEARRLDELLLSAQVDRIEAELNLGRLDHLAELTALVARHPVNERLRGQLMTTLYRLGRQADALACYRDAREALVAELGVEPGPALQALHSAILRGDGGTLRVKAPERQRAAPPVVPAQIPPTPPDFTGRRAERTALVELLRGSAPGVHVLTGPGGSGKSALATRVAQQVAEAFPDGQLYCDLRGLDDAPAAPEEVLAGSLRSLGVSVGQLPESTQERTELFRSMLAGRRVLILLDDAAGVQQVRPLLPGEPHCGVLVTSRNRLAGLAGATLIELDVMTDEEARRLFIRIVGTERVQDDGSSTRRILGACENLPLAIRIAGARLATRRHLPLVFRLANDITVM